MSKFMNIVEFGIERIKIYLKRGFLVRVKEYANKHKHKSKRVYAYELIGMSSFTLLQTLRDHLEGSYSTPAQHPHKQAFFLFLLYFGYDGRPQGLPHLIFSKPIYKVANIRGGQYLRWPIYEVANIWGGQYIRLPIFEVANI